MVVDDTPSNIQTVGAVLRTQGYRIIAVRCGEDVFPALEQHTPDVILLDIFMPDIDGIEVCRRLKASPSFAAIPVIFLTALSEEEHILKGFEAGGVDYITKPFNASELLARVKTQLEIVHARSIILQQNAELRRLHEVKNDFIGMAAHDLRVALTSIQGLAEILWKQEKPTEKVQYFSKIIFESAQHLHEIVENLLNVHRIEAQGLKPQRDVFDVVQTLHKMIRLFQPRAQVKSITLQLQTTLSSLLTSDDENMVGQIMENLLSNAIKYSPHGKAITIGLECQARPANTPPRIRLHVQDQGPGISKLEQQKLFGKFARLSSKPTGSETATGLGLAITKALATALDGDVWCESELGNGARFVVQVPLRPPLHPPAGE
jgi:signal transduction histidine kinase